MTGPEHIQKSVHDATVLGAGATAFGVTLTDVEMWMKLAVLAATLIFVIFGCWLRWTKIRRK